MREDLEGVGLSAKPIRWRGVIGTLASICLWRGVFGVGSWHTFSWSSFKFVAPLEFDFENCAAPSQFGDETL